MYTLFYSLSVSWWEKDGMKHNTIKLNSEYYIANLEFT